MIPRVPKISVICDLNAAMNINKSKLLYRLMKFTYIIANNYFIQNMTFRVSERAGNQVRPTFRWCTRCSENN